MNLSVARNTVSTSANKNLNASLTSKIQNQIQGLNDKTQPTIGLPNPKAKPAESKLDYNQLYFNQNGTNNQKKIGLPNPNPQPKIGLPNPIYDTKFIQDNLIKFESSKKSLDSQLNNILRAENSGKGGNNSAAIKQANASTQSLISNIEKFVSWRYPEFQNIKPDARKTGQSTESVLARLKAATESAKKDANDLEFRKGRLPSGGLIPPGSNQSTKAIVERLQNDLGKVMTNTNDLFFRKGLGSVGTAAY